MTGRRCRRARSAAVLGLLLLAAAGCVRPAAPPRGVILVLVDALRADRLGCYGYRERPTSPRIDALAADATRFAHAVSSTPWTLPSMATLFTGLYPSLHGATLASDIGRWLTDHGHFEPVTTLDASRTTLAEVLRAQGFATGGLRARFVSRAGVRHGPGLRRATSRTRGPASASTSMRCSRGSTASSRSASSPTSTRPRCTRRTRRRRREARWSPDSPDAERSRRSPAPSTRSARATASWTSIRRYRGWLDGSWESLRPIRTGRRPDARDRGAPGRAVRPRHRLHRLLDRPPAGRAGASASCSSGRS